MSTSAVNNDVIPQCGGFLLVYISPGGVIYARDEVEDGPYSANQMVHKETRNMHYWKGCYSLFSSAKRSIGTGKHSTTSYTQAILELTSDGGGAAIWAYKDKINDLTERMAKWKGCYGAWPVRELKRGT